MSIWKTNNNHLIFGFSSHSVLNDATYPNLDDSSCLF